MASRHPGKLISPLQILYRTLKGKKAGAEERLATQVSSGTDFSQNHGGYGRFDHSHFSSIIAPAASVQHEHATLSS